MDWTYHTAPSNGIYSLFFRIFQWLWASPICYICHTPWRYPWPHFFQIPSIYKINWDNVPRLNQGLFNNVIVLRPNTLTKPYVHHQSWPTAALYNFKEGNYLMINDNLSQVDWNAHFQFCPNVDCCWKEFRYQTDLAIEILFQNSHSLIESIKLIIPSSLINCSRQTPNFGEIGGRTLVMPIEICISDLLRDASH